MSVTAPTPQVVTNTALFHLYNELGFVRDLDNRSSDFKNAKTGMTSRIRKPAQFATTTAHDLSSSIGNVVESYVDLTIDAAPTSIALEWASDEEVTNFGNVEQRVIQPAMRRLAAAIESDFMSRLLRQISRSVNGAALTHNLVSSASARLDKSLADGARRACLHPDHMQDLRDDTKSLFNAPSSQYSGASVGKLADFDMWTSALTPSLTTGSRAGDASGVQTTVSTQGATTMAINVGSGTETVAAGEVFTVAAVYEINPQNKNRYDNLKQFVVLEAATATSGVATVTVAPMYTTADASGRANISAFPQSGAAVTWLGGVSATVSQSLLYAPNFASVAFLELPVGPDVKGYTSTMGGISLRYQKQTDIIKDRTVHRFDVQGGVVLVQDEYACRFVRTGATTTA